VATRAPRESDQLNWMIILNFIWRFGRIRIRFDLRGALTRQTRGPRGIALRVPSAEMLEGVAQSFINVLETAQASHRPGVLLQQKNIFTLLSVCKRSR